MHRLLIVDDEPHIAEWLYELLSGADSLDLDLYMAYSAEEGLELMIQQRFDILLTDIHMPGMSGIEFVRRVYESWPACKVIFLTGYDEFEYAYKAIQYDSVGYILKLEDDDVIVETVAKAVAMLNDVSRYQSLLQKVDRKDAVIRYLVEREAVSRYIRGGNDMGDLPLDSGRPVLLVCGRKGECDLSDPLLNAKKGARLMLLSEEFFQSRMTFVLMEYRMFDYIWLLQPQEGAEEQKEQMLLYLAETLDAFQRACKQVAEASLSFTFFEEYVSWSELGEKIDLLNRVASTRTVYEGGQPYVFSSASLPSADLFTPPPAVAQLHSTGRLLLLESYLEHGNKEQFLVCLQEVSASFTEIPSMHDLSATETYMRIATMLLSHINRCGLAARLVFSISLGRLTRLAEFASWEEATGYLSTVSEKLFELQRYEQENRTTSLIEQIKAYVDEHLDSDLSLTQISRHAHYSNSYVSRVFKREIGQNLIDYIVGVRIHRAKQLLVTTRHTIKAIGAMVGYESPQYFSTVFRRELGLSPQEYRDHSHSV